MHEHLRGWGRKVGVSNYYSELGIPRNASATAMRVLWRKRSKEVHPDKFPGDEGAHDRFISLHSMYEVLRDDDLRRIYDRFGQEALETHMEDPNVCFPADAK